MEVDSSSAEGKGDNVLVGTEEKGQEDSSGSQEVMDIDEEAHPHKKQRTQGPNDIGVELSDEEIPELRGPEKDKPGFHVSFYNTSFSAPS